MTFICKHFMWLIQSQSTLKGKENYILVLALSCEFLALSILTFTSWGFSKNLTKAGSFNKDARICSKAKDHSWFPLKVCALLPSVCSELLSSCPFLGISAGTSITATGLLTGDVGPCSLLPTSSIFSRRLVTTAIARYNSSSSGSPWNRLYRVFENWMNWDYREIQRRLFREQQRNCPVSAQAVISNQCLLLLGAWYNNSLTAIWVWTRPDKPQCVWKSLSSHAYSYSSLK